MPSLLIHLSVIDLTTSNAASGLNSIFPDTKKEGFIEALLALPPPTSTGTGDTKSKSIPKEGPILTTKQAFILRAAAIDACNLIIETARTLGNDEIRARTQADADISWLKSMTLPEIDAWLWAVAKDRVDCGRLERFVLRNTPYF